MQEEETWINSLKYLYIDTVIVWRLQIKNIIYHTVKDALAVLRNSEPLSFW